MAHVLLGWELGGNRGHRIKLLDLAARLREEGHRISFAVQRLDAIPPKVAADSPVLQAPLSPRLLLDSPRKRSAPPATYGDVLARLGFDDPDLLAGMLTGWRGILGLLNPDVVLAEYAPFLLLACAGKIPAIALGNGFTLPPADLLCFPSLTGGSPVAQEAETLGAVNRGLKAAGAAPIDRLPAVYAAERSVVATFEELDPYRQVRTGPLAPPHFGSALPPLAAGKGKEVFVSTAAGPDSRLWEGLVAAGLPVRAHVPRFSGEQRAALAKRGFRVEADAVPFARIAARSRILLSHGGLGTVSSGLVAGLPQIVCHHDLEKALTGIAVAGLGVGGHLSSASLDPVRFAASLQAMYDDPSFGARASAAAPGFRARCDVPFVEHAARAVAELA